MSNIDYHFENKRVLVTGATSGMGQAVAVSFAKAGASVMLTGRSEQKGKTLIDQLTLMGCDVSFIAGDLTDRQFCDQLVEHAVKKMGGLDIVVNSAGVIFHGTVEETTDEQWLETMNVNVNGMFFVCRAVMPHLKKSPGSVILNIASDAGLTASYHLTAYCASKGAVLQMSRAMAKDYAPDVRVIPICPGDVDTPMLRGEFKERGIDARTGLNESAEGVPMKRVCSADEIADLVLYAASDSARFITGYPLVIDGGSRA
ncbi:MAG: glucose 1-dehydrogenase [Gammaproteobacteria bacterium]|nr:glucose 1-dehydrogenase [Gammaproteobacteria bacterium]